MPCYFILAERSIPMGFRSMVSSTLISIAAITVGGVLTVIGIVREIRPLAIGGIVLAAMGVIFFIAAFIRAWRSLKREKKRKGVPSDEFIPWQRQAGAKAGPK